MIPSKEKQNFKIGRMTYGLPGTVDVEGETHYLVFGVRPDGGWLACYQDVHGLVEFMVKADTFNKVVKAMHKAVKELPND